MKNYIPKHKSDIEAVERLNLLSFEMVRADVPSLLECVQDMHWDIGSEVAAYLLPHIYEIQGELLDILNTNDEVWKYNIIRSLLAKSPIRPDEELMSIIQRIADHPTKSEKEDDVDEAAKELIMQYSNINP